MNEEKKIIEKHRALFQFCKSQRQTKLTAGSITLERTARQWFGQFSQEKLLWKARKLREEFDTLAAFC